jgi:hypothetical protein
MWMDDIALIGLNASITVFALGMLIISLLSYRRYKNWQLLFVSGAFFLFFIKGLLQSLSLFYTEMSMLYDRLSLGVFDLVILILLFMATLKR